MLLVEDVGEVPLFEAALHSDGGDLYRLAADELLVLHLEGTRQIDDRCIASRIRIRRTVVSLGAIAIR